MPARLLGRRWTFHTRSSRVDRLSSLVVIESPARHSDRRWSFLPPLLLPLLLLRPHRSPLSQQKEALPSLHPQLQYLKQLNDSRADGGLIMLPFEEADGDFVVVVVVGGGGGGDEEVFMSVTPVFAAMGFQEPGASQGAKSVVEAVKRVSG